MGKLAGEMLKRIALLTITMSTTGAARTPSPSANSLVRRSCSYQPMIVIPGTTIPATARTLSTVAGHNDARPRPST
jgi:hypothetical protein